MISGSATSLAAAADHVVTARNSGGSTTATVNVSVLDKPPCAFVYEHPVEGYEKDVPVRVNDVTFTANSTCSTAVSFSLAEGSLPSGLALAPDTGGSPALPERFTRPRRTPSWRRTREAKSQRGINVGVYLPPASRYVVRLASRRRPMTSTCPTSTGP